MKRCILGVACFWKAIRSDFLTKCQCHHATNSACCQSRFRYLPAKSRPNHQLGDKLCIVGAVSNNVPRNSLHVLLDLCIKLHATTFKGIHPLQDIEGVIAHVQSRMSDVKQLRVEASVQDSDVVPHTNIVSPTTAYLRIIEADYKLCSVDLSTMLVVQEYTTVTHQRTVPRVTSPIEFRVQPLEHHEGAPQCLALHWTQELIHACNLQSRLHFFLCHRNHIVTRFIKHFAY
mmetsp:Transcript_20167/g.36528  ORF Transcript_20167/g.36528 Transcript_20167/m.36528 type:complete len:231 (-) Transcript_20167:142-834(-)